MFPHQSSSTTPLHFQSWKAFMVSTMLLALLPVLPSQASARTAQNSGKELPVFDINKTEYTFGDRFIGEELIARFTVRNLGAAPLMLSETPVLTGTPTVGVYRRLQSEGLQGVQDWLQPAGLRKGAFPYT
jgi:hypothetical protein